MEKASGLFEEKFNITYSENCVKNFWNTEKRKLQKGLNKKVPSPQHFERDFEQQQLKISTVTKHHSPNDEFIPYDTHKSHAYTSRAIITSTAMRHTFCTSRYTPYSSKLSTLEPRVEFKTQDQDRSLLLKIRIL